LAQIVGFRVEIDRIEGKWKLSQNHPVERRENVIRALDARGDENSTAIAAMMRTKLPESSFSDEELLDRFENRALVHEQWNHRAHLRVAYLYASRNDLDSSVAKMRSGLLRLNASHKAPDTLKRGYHETITIAYMRLIHALVSRGGAADSSTAFCESYPALLDRRLLSRFYSDERLWTYAAKQVYVQPDLTPLNTSNRPEVLEGCLTSLGRRTDAKQQRASIPWVGCEFFLTVTELGAV
jgi:hypothetical protein